LDSAEDWVPEEAWEEEPDEKTGSAIIPENSGIFKPNYFLHN
jgi:hypothetical protein